MQSITRLLSTVKTSKAKAAIRENMSGFEAIALSVIVRKPVVAQQFGFVVSRFESMVARNRPLV